MQTSDNIGACVSEWFQQECGSSAPWQCKASYGKHNHGTLAEIQVGGSRSPSIQSRPLSLQLCLFGLLKKALRGKWFTSDDVKQYVQNWFITQPWEFYEIASHCLVSQWDKGLNSQGQYFWHTGNGFCSYSSGFFLFWMPFIFNWYLGQIHLIYLSLIWNVYNLFVILS